ncbi:MAG: glycosyltransferase family 39 protein [Chloracidobacterium sp.]|uniref:Glycosyltransferase family 39 protein n=1 Tax=Chloracidobacterium validum TaxID=2821543 RepID=A0ABX8B708_9BACT|nr:glycosyltransferase family 39 protein [Chloracidobacterium validum]QUW02222.1 glycosyltransferase family 39 protein [Chloracidobacterium validum]
MTDGSAKVAAGRDALRLSSNAIPAWTDESRLADGLAGFLLAGLTAAFTFFVTRRIGTIPAPTATEGLLAHEALTNGLALTRPALDWTLWAFLNAFGDGVAQVRVYGILLALVTLVVTYLIGRKLHSRAAGLIGVACLMGDPNFFGSLRTLRPETGAVACAFLGFYLLLRAQATDRLGHKWLWALTSGWMSLAAGWFDHIGLLMFLCMLAWTLVQRGDLLGSLSWRIYLLGVSLWLVPYGGWVASHWSAYSQQSAQIAAVIYNRSSVGMWDNLAAEAQRYAAWSGGLLLIPTPDSLSARLFQCLALASLVYLSVRTIRTISHMVLHWQFVRELRKRFGGMPAPAELQELYASGEVKLPKVGTLESWMFERGGLLRRLSLIVQEIEKDTRPITHWLQALGAPSHPDWRIPRTGLLIVTITSLVGLALFDSHKVPAVLPFVTVWFALCIGVFVVDALRWAVDQRRRAVPRVLRGLAVGLLVVSLVTAALGSGARAVWRFHRWTRTFTPAPYADLATVLRQVVAPGATVVGNDIHRFAFPPGTHYVTPLGNDNFLDWAAGGAEPVVLITDDTPESQVLRDVAETRRWPLIAELSGTLYGTVRVYRLTMAEGSASSPARYYFMGSTNGYARRGYYSEQQRQEAALVWLAEPTELERLTRELPASEMRPPEVQRDGNQLVLRIVTDVSNYTTRLRLPLPPLKPHVMYRLQTAVRVTQGGAVVGVRDRTGLWLNEPVALGESQTYVPIDILFVTNERGDAELAIGNRRNQPAASAMYLGRVEVRQIGASP